MKKILFAGLTLIVVGCTSGSPDSDGDSGTKGDSLAGSYYDKRQRSTLIISQNDKGGYSVQFKGLTGDSKSEELTLASSDVVKTYFMNEKDGQKPGTYYKFGSGLCSNMLIKYEGDDSAHISACGMDPSKYVRQ